MKIKHLIMSILFLSTFFVAKAQLLLDENFSYSSGDSLVSTVLSKGWLQIGTIATNRISVNSGSLSLTGFKNSGVGNSAMIQSSGQDIYKEVGTSVSTGAIYTGMLINVSAAQTAGDYFFAYLPSASTTTYTARLFSKLSSVGFYRIGISKAAVGVNETVVYSADSFALNSTYSLVVKYQFNTSSVTDDSIKIFLHSGSFPATEPLVASTQNTGAINPVTDASNLARIALRQGSAANASTLTIDGITVTNSWADLTSSGATTPPSPITSPSLMPTGKTTASLSWTKPVGYIDSAMTTLVFLKQGSAIAVGTPTNNPSAYSENADYAMASSSYQADSNAKCVFNNDGNSVSVSGLALGNSYHALIYVVRNGDSSYSTGVNGNFQTVGLPINVSSLSFVATGQTTSTINWTKPVRYADSTMTTLVFVKETNAIIQGTPSLSSNNYTADTNFIGVGTVYQNDSLAHCVYNAQGTAVNISNLILGATYHVLVYVVRNVDTTYSVANTTSGATFGAIVPPIPLSSVRQGEVGSFSSVIQWEKNALYNDSSMSILVYMKKNTSITQGSPKTDVNSISSNSVFGLGSTLQSDTLARCIYKGDSSNINVTNLQAGTTYTLLAYVVRDADTSYSTAVTNSFATLMPPVAPINLSFTNLTSSGFTLNWNRGLNYDTINSSTVVFVKQAAAVTIGSPSFNADKYSSNAIFASGSSYQNDSSAYCVFKGTSSIAQVSGLTPGTSYHILIYTIRNNDSVYSAEAIANTTTLLGQPATATSLLLKGTGISTATISWTKPAEYNNANYTTLVFVKKDIVSFDVPSGNTSKYNASSAFGLGTKLPGDTNAYCVFKADTNTINISLLKTNSSYFASIYIVRNADSAYSVSANVSGSTLDIAPYYPIGAINSINPTTGVPDSIGVRTTVRGIVYGANQRASGLQFVLRDVTGGTTVFITTKTFGYTVAQGDSIEVQGVVSTFRGLHQIGTLDTLIKMGTGVKLQDPITVTKIEEASENNLVKINNVQFITRPLGGVWPTASSNIAVVNSNNDTIVLRILSTFAIAGKPLPLTPTFNVVGLGAQFSTNSVAPFAFNGYQLFPRNDSDITPIPVVITDSLTSFDLLTPADNDTIVITTQNMNDTVVLSWTPSINSNGVDTTNYTLVMDTLGGDFSNPVFEMSTGSFNVFPLTIAQIYSLVLSNGISEGEVFADIWKVKATSQNLVRYSTSTRNIFIKNDVFTGISELNLANRISLYPNPTYGAARLTGLTPNKDIITLTDFTGRKMLQVNALSSEVELLNVNMTPGIYFVRIQSGSAIVVKKMIVQ